MPVWLIWSALAVGVLATSATLGAALWTGAWELLPHAASGLFGVAVLAVLLRRGDAHLSGPGPRLPRALGAGGCALAALAATLACDWRLDSLWTPLALLVVTWLALLAIAFAARPPRDPS